MLLVSHDREFLNNVVGSSIVFEDGRVKEYDGGYDDWIRQRENSKRDTGSTKSAIAQNEKPKREKSNKVKPKPDAPRRLKYAEKKELENLPTTIEELESKIQELQTSMAEPSYYRQPADVLARNKSDLDKLETDLTAAYSRWEELEAVQEN